MNTYSYVVLDHKGNKRKGTVDANSIDAARKMIAITGKTLVSIKEPTLLSKLKIKKKVKARDLAIFCQQMSSMLKSGVTVTDAMNMIATSTDNVILKDAILNCSLLVGKGDTLSSAMKRYPAVFPFMLVQMLNAAEASGSIDDTFLRMSVQFDKSQKTHDTIKKALNYPKLVLAIAVIAVVVISVVVIPMFVSIFEEMGTELPAVTKFMLGLSDFFTTKWYILIPIVIVLFFGFKIFVKSQKGKKIINKVKMFIKPVHDLVQKTATANMARLLSTLLGSGMYMAEALTIVENTMEDDLYKKTLSDIKRDVLNGYTLFDAVDATDMFPPLFLNLIAIGEKTGEISEMLEKAADYFEEEVDLATQRLSSAIQPIMIVIIGGIVGLLVYAVYGPMMSMYDGLQ